MSATVRRIRLGDQYAEKAPQNTVEHKLSIAETSQYTVVSRKETVLKTIADMRAEIGRMNKLADQLEAEFLRASD